MQPDGERGKQIVDVGVRSPHGPEKGSTACGCVTGMFAATAGRRFNSGQVHMP